MAAGLKLPGFVPFEPNIFKQTVGLDVLHTFSTVVL